MHFVKSLASSAVLAGVVCALPNSIAKHAHVKRQNGPGGFAGVAVDGTDVTQVSATITVSTPSVPPGGDSSTQYGDASWVGIEDSSGSTLWQTGLTWTIQSGAVSYTSWYEWYPGPSAGFSTNLEYSAGDQIYMEVVATSSTSGTATLQNLSTGQSVTVTVSGQAENDLGIAEWFVEDYEAGGGSEPFASFSPSIEWSSCSFTDSSGSGQGISGGSISNINGYASAHIQSDSSFSVSSDQ